MKKIVINGKFLCQRITGVQRYAREIINELDKIIEPDTIELLIPNVDVELPNYKNIKIIKYGKFKNNLWEQISLPRYVKRNKSTCLSLCNSAPIMTPHIITIHDTKIKVYPKFFSRKFRIWYNFMCKKNVKKAKSVLTVSNFSKSEIVKFYKINENKISIISDAWQHYDRVQFSTNALTKYGLGKKEFYYAMGSMDPNKNFKWIAEVAKKNPNSIFAISGAFNNKVFSSKLDYIIPKNMKFLGFVSDEEAKTLMRDCKAFLFPSIYEGFGIPPLEAISAGCNKVFLLDTIVNKEIYGDFVYYIDNKNFDLDNYLEKDLNYNELLKKYSWADSAYKLKTILDDYIMK